MSDPVAPSISVKLILDPPSFKEGEAVELSVEAVSRASCPITILDYGSIFNVHLAQSLRRSGGNFCLSDIDTDTELSLQNTGCKKRSAIQYKLNHSDSRCIHFTQMCLTNSALLARYHIWSWFQVIGTACQSERKKG
jgi:hypothetical protein